MVEDKKSTKQYASWVCAPIMNKNGNKEVVLCIHGFCGSPGFFLPMADMVRDAGYDLCAPLLSGHGTKYQDLKDAKAEIWLEDMKMTMDMLLPEYDKIHVIGVSLGGDLAIWVASKYASTGKIGKVMLMVPGLALRDKKFETMDYENCGDSGFPLVQSADTPPELVESSFLYEFAYFKGVGELVKLGRICWDTVDDLTEPTWLLYTNADPVVDPERNAELAKRLKNLVFLHVYEKSGHNLLLDCEREDVYKHIAEFLKS